MTFRFIWKILGSDIFEQDFRDYTSRTEAKESWKMLWGVDENSLEYLKIEEVTDETESEQTTQ